MIVVPALDIRDGRCVRLVQGDYDRELRYDADPVEAARALARGGARLIHVVDLDAARDGRRRNADLVARMVEAAGVPVEVGGGIRDEAAVEAVLATGAAHAIVGTWAAEDPAALDRLGARFGPRVVLGLDVKDGRVAVRGWEAAAAVDALELARRARAAGLVRCVYTEVSRDGMLEGPDVDGGTSLQAASGLKVTLSGGVGALEHLARAAAAGLHACIVGRALLDGRFTLADALATVAGASRSDPAPEGPCSPGA